MESEILGFGIRNTAQGIRNATNKWLESGTHVSLTKNPEFSNWNPVSRAWNPESFPYMGRQITQVWLYPGVAASKRQIDNSFSWKHYNLKIVLEASLHCLASHNLPKNFSNIRRITKVLLLVSCEKGICAVQVTLISDPYQWTMKVFISECEWRV